MAVFSYVGGSVSIATGGYGNLAVRKGAQVAQPNTITASARSFTEGTPAAGLFNGVDRSFLYSRITFTSGFSANKLNFNTTEPYNNKAYSSSAYYTPFETVFNDLDYSDYNTSTSSGEYWAHAYGYTNTEFGTAIAVDKNRNAWVVGNTDFSGCTITNIGASLTAVGSFTNNTTTPTAGTNDSGYFAPWTLPFQHNIFRMNQTSSVLAVMTNSWITFDGAVNNTLATFSGTSPNWANLQIAAGENSCQRVYWGTFGTAPNRTFRIRFEGTNATTGTLGSPNIVWEFILYESNPNIFDIQTGTITPPATSFSGISDGTSYFGTFTPASNSGYRFTTTNVTVGASSNNITLVKYDTKGQFQRSKDFPPYTGSDDLAVLSIGRTGPEVGEAIKVGSDGRIYILFTTASIGYISGVSTNDFGIIKIDPDLYFKESSGNSAGTVWAKTFGTTTTDTGQSLDIDSNDNLYISGFTTGSGQGSNDVIVLKIDKNANIVWKKTYGAVGGDLGNAIKASPDGSVYVWGYSGSTPLIGTTDYFLLKINGSTGALVWQKHFNISATTGAQVFENSIDVDPFGNVYVNGYSATNPNGYFVAKIDPAGNFKWSRNVGAVTANPDAGTSVKYKNGFIYVAGQDSSTTNNAEGIGLGVTKIDAHSGQIISNYVIGGVNSEYAYAIDIDDYNDIYATGAVTTSMTGLTSATGANALVTKFILDTPQGGFTVSGDARVWSSTTAKRYTTSRQAFTAEDIVFQNDLIATGQQFIFVGTTTESQVKFEKEFRFAGSGSLKGITAWQVAATTVQYNRATNNLANNSYYTKVNGTVATATNTNPITGLSDSSIWSFTQTTAAAYITPTSPTGTFAAGSDFYFSVFAKSNNFNKITLLGYNPPFTLGTGNVEIRFDLNTGVSTVVNSANKPLAYGMIPYEDGWWRIFIKVKLGTASDQSSGAGWFQIRHTGDSSIGSNVYLYGPQLQPGILTKYIENTSTVASSGLTTSFVEDDTLLVDRTLSTPITAPSTQLFTLSGTPTITYKNAFNKPVQTYRGSSDLSLLNGYEVVFDPDLYTGKVQYRVYNSILYSTEKFEKEFRFSGSGSITSSGVNVIADVTFKGGVGAPSTQLFTIGNGYTNDKFIRYYVSNYSRNLFANPESLEFPIWQKVSSTVSQNAVAALDRTLTVEKLIGNLNATGRQSIRQDVSVVSGTRYTFSVFLKAAGRRYATIWFDHPSSELLDGAYIGAGNVIDLETGTVFTPTQVVTKTIPYPNGWYRVYVSATPTFTGNLRLQIGIGTPNNLNEPEVYNDYKYIGDGSSGIYVWGAQFEASSTLSPYVSQSGRVFSEGSGTNITASGDARIKAPNRHIGSSPIEYYNPSQVAFGDGENFRASEIKADATAFYRFQKGAFSATGFITSVNTASNRTARVAFIPLNTLLLFNTNVFTKLAMRYAGKSPTTPFGGLEIVFEELEANAPPQEFKYTGAASKPIRTFRWVATPSAITTSGTAVEKFTDAYAVSGSLTTGFGAGAKVTFRPFDAVDSDPLFSINGQHGTRVFVPNWIATGSTATSGSLSNLKRSSSWVGSSPIQYFDPQEVIFKDGENFRASEFKYESTALYRFQKGTFSGTGSIVGDPNATAAVVFNPPDTAAGIQLFSISGQYSNLRFTKKSSEASGNISITGAATPPASKYAWVGSSPIEYYNANQIVFGEGENFRASEFKYDSTSLYRFQKGTFNGTGSKQISSAQNIFERSERFDVWWNGFGLTSRSRVQNIEPPLGLTYVTKIVESLDGANAYHGVSRGSGITFVAGTTYTISIFAKAAERSQLIFGFDPPAFTTNFEYGIFDLNTGTAAAFIPAAGNPTVSIIPYPNGWYRCSVTKTCTTTSSSNALSFQIINNSSNFYTGDGTSGLYITGAQLDEHDSFSPYVLTDGAPVNRVTFKSVSFNPPDEAAGVQLFNVTGAYSDLRSTSRNVITAAPLFTGGFGSAAVSFNPPDTSAETQLFTITGSLVERYTKGLYTGTGSIIIEDKENLLHYSNNLLQSNVDYAPGWSFIDGSGIVSLAGQNSYGNYFSVTFSNSASNTIRTGFTVFTNRQRQYTISFNIKSDTVNQIQFKIQNTNIGDVSNTITLIKTNGIDLGDGWYRVSGTVTTNNFGNFCRFNPVLSTNGEIIYLQNFQLELGTLATNYNETDSTIFQKAEYEKITANPPDEAAGVQLFTITGQHGTRVFVPNWIATGTVRSQDGVNQAVLKQSSVWVGSSPIEYYNADQIIFGEGENFRASEFKYDSTAFYRFQNGVFSGTGSIATDPNASAAVVFNPPDTAAGIQLFTVSGAYSDLRFIKKVPADAVLLNVVISGAASQPTTNYSLVGSSPTAYFNPDDIVFGEDEDGIPTEYRNTSTANYKNIFAISGSGTLFSASGAAEAFGVNPVDTTQLFDISGSYSNLRSTFDLAPFGGTINITGAATQPPVNYSWVGSSPKAYFNPDDIVFGEDEDGTPTEYRNTSTGLYRTQITQTGSGSITSDNLGSAAVIFNPPDEAAGVQLFTISGTYSNLQFISQAGEAPVLFQISGAATQIASGYTWIGLSPFTYFSAGQIVFEDGENFNNTTFKYDSTASYRFQNATFSGSGSIASGNLGSATVTFNPPDTAAAIQLFTISGQHGTRVFVPSWPGSGSTTLSGSGSQSIKYANFTGNSPSAYIDPYEVVFGEEENYGSTDISLSGYSKFSATPRGEVGSGALFTGGFFSNLKAIFRPFDATDSEQLFSINGQHGTKVFVPNWIATGSLSTGFEGSAKVTFNPPEFDPLFTTSGAAVDKHIDVASGSGNLFTASGGAQKVIFRPVDATDTDFLFSISGTAGIKLRDYVWVSAVVEYDPYEYVINDEFIIPDFIKIKTTFEWDNVNNIYRSLSTESITVEQDASGSTSVAGNVGTRTFVPNWRGSGSVSVTGAATEKHIDAASGSGNLFAASGASQSVGANPPDDTALFVVSGTVVEKHIDRTSGSGTTTVTGTAIESHTDVTAGSGEAVFGDGSATVQIINYNAFGGLISVSQNATASVTFNPPEADPLFTLSGAATESQTDITSGGGSIATDISSVSRVVFNPADTEQLFEVTGAYSDLKFTSDYNASGTIAVSGTVVEKHIDVAIGSGSSTLTGEATESHTDIAIPGTGTIEFSGEAVDEYASGGLRGSGTLFIIDGGSARVTFNPPEGNQLFDVSGSFSDIKITSDYEATGSATLEGTLGSRIFVPNWIGSGTIEVTGESTQSHVDITSGSGALFTDGFYSNLKATFRSVSDVGLFDVTGTLVEKHIDAATGSGSATFAGAASESQTDITSGSGTLFSGGLYSNLRVTFNPSEEPALFAITGFATEKQTNREIGSGSISISGTLVEKHIDAATGSGSIAAGFNASASVTFRPFDATDTDSLFSILGSAIEKNTESYVGSGNATFSGTAAESQRNITSGSGALFTDGFFSDFKATFRPFDATDLDPLFSINGSAVEKNTESYVGTGSGVFTGDVVQKHIDVASGSGTLFSASGAAEATGVNPPEDTALFDISGAASERYFARIIGSGSITTSFGGAVSVTFNPPEGIQLFTVSGSYSNLNFISANVVSGTATFSGTVAEKHVDAATGSGSATFNGTAVEKQTDITSGSGSLFTASGASESIGANPPEDTALFDVSGTYSNLKFISANIVSGTAEFTGDVVEKHIDSAIGSGSATFDGTAVESQTDITSGSGSLFAASGAAEAFGANPPEDTALFEVTGAYSDLKSTSAWVGTGTLFTVSGAAESVTFNPPEDTQLFDITGAGSEAQRNVALPGSGSLFAAFGGTASVTFDPPEDTQLFDVSGTYSDLKFISANVASGSTTFSGTVIEKFVSSNIASGSTEISGTLVERKTDIALPGSGSLFTAFGGTASVTFNPPEDTQLFEISGDYSDLKATSAYAGSGSLFAFSGAVVVTTISEVGTGLFDITDTATESTTYKTIDGTGSLFGFAGGVESVTFNPVENTQLFEVSGEVYVTTTFGYGGGVLEISGSGEAIFRRALVPQQGSGEILSTGESSNSKIFSPYVGSGSLFAASGSAQATTNVPPIDPIIWEDDLRTTLYLVSGSASVSRTASIDNDVTINISGSGVARTVLPERIFATII